MSLSHVKTLVLAGTLRERVFHSSLPYPRRMEGKKNPILSGAGAIIANYLLDFFFHVVSVCGGWVMIAKTFTFGVFWPLSGYKTPPIVTRMDFPWTILFIAVLFCICTKMLPGKYVGVSS